MKRREKKQRADGSFLSGVLILSVSTVLVKVIGLFSKIPLIGCLGAQGMGYFNSAYEIYALLCVISTAGLPVALAMLISAARERGEMGQTAHIFRCGFWIFCILGVLSSAGMLLFADSIASAIGNVDAAPCIVAISPALLLVCISSAVRGYFQGYRRMGPTAVSQLIEAVGKLVLGVPFALFALKRGYSIPVAASYAVWGLTLGTLLSTLYLLFLKAKESRGKLEHLPLKTVAKSRERTFSLLVKIAFPITVSSAVLGVTRTVDMALILRRLGDVGVPLSRANAIYGSYTTLSLPIFSLIPALITPIALSLVPQLSAAIESRTESGQSRVVSDAIRLTVLLSLPASMGIAVYARPILSLLFSGEPEAVDIAAPLLSVLGVSVFFSCMITTTNAVLQSYRKPNLAVLSTVIGSGVKIVSAYVFIGIPQIGVYGAPISTFLCNVTVTGLNLWFVYACVPGKKEIVPVYFKPFLASLGAILLSVAVYVPMLSFCGRETLAFLGALPVALVFYVIFAWVTRAVTKDDLAMLPHSKKETSKKSEKHTVTKTEP